MGYNFVSTTAELSPKMAEATESLELSGLRRARTISIRDLPLEDATR